MCFFHEQHDTKESKKATVTPKQKSNDALPHLPYWRNCTIYAVVSRPCINYPTMKTRSNNYRRVGGVRKCTQVQVKPPPKAAAAKPEPCKKPPALNMQPWVPPVFERVLGEVPTCQSHYNCLRKLARQQPGYQCELFYVQHYHWYDSQKGVPGAGDEALFFYNPLSLRTTTVRTHRHGPDYSGESKDNPLATSIGLGKQAGVFRSAEFAKKIRALRVGDPIYQLDEGDGGLAGGVFRVTRNWSPKRDQKIYVLGVNADGLWQKVTIQSINPRLVMLDDDGFGLFV